MLVSDAAKRIDASENTIRNYVKKNEKYYTIVDDVIHITKEGLESLEKKYKIKAEVMSNDNIYFYEGQILSLQRQIEIQLQQFNIYQLQLEQQHGLVETYKKEIEYKKQETQNKEIELMKKNEELLKLKKELIEKDSEIKDMHEELENEKNKSIWKKIFNK